MVYLVNHTIMNLVNAMLQYNNITVECSSFIYYARRVTSAIGYNWILKYHHTVQKCPSTVQMLGPEAVDVISKRMH